MGSFSIPENIKVSSWGTTQSVEMHIYCTQPCSILRDIWVSFTVRKYSGSPLRVSSENGGRFGPLFWLGKKVAGKSQKKNLARKERRVIKIFKSVIIFK